MMVVVADTTAQVQSNIEAIPAAIMVVPMNNNDMMANNVVMNVPINASNAKLAHKPATEMERVMEESKVIAAREELATPSKAAHPLSV